MLWGVKPRVFGLVLLLLLLFTYVFIVNAWVVDDAYITFRTVDNFIHGYGLRWNPAERVQAYTHPLWLFLVSLFAFLTADVYYTSIGISYVLCVVLLLVAARRFARETPWKVVLLILTLLASKAVMDYTSSGLETALSYLLATLFFVQFLRSERGVIDLRWRELFGLLFIGALAFLNRFDTVLLYAPALAYLAWVYAPRLRWRFLLLLAPAALPVAIWLVFSLLYYGSPWPNTTYAKLLNAAVPLADKTERGLFFLANSVSWDLASYVVLLATVGLAIWRRRLTAGLALVGVFLYLVYTVTTAAAATHLSGRFFALPLMVTFIVFTVLIPRGRTPALCCLLLMVYVLWSPISSIKMGTRFYRPPPQNRDYIDANWFAHEERAALISDTGGRPLPDHRWFHAGHGLRVTPERVHVGGEYGGPAIGFFAYAAGPDKHIVDWCALGDPLLSRLPAAHVSYWKSGHFCRELPAGYLESLETSENRIKDPALRQFYDKVRRITRGPIFDRQRLSDIVQMNLGRHQHLVDAYVARRKAEGGDGCEGKIPAATGPVYPLK